MRPERFGLEQQDRLTPAIPRESLTRSVEYANIEVRIHRDPKRPGSRLGNAHLAGERFSKSIVTRTVRKVQASSFRVKKVEYITVS